MLLNTQVLFSLEASCSLSRSQSDPYHPQSGIVAALNAKYSHNSHILEVLDLAFTFDREHSAFYWPLFNRIMRIMSKGNVPWKPSAAPSYLEYFDEHYTLVRRLVPRDRLLEWHPSQGWGPVCEFLDLPVPAKEFPHICTSDGNVLTHASTYWRRWRHVVQKGVQTVSLIGLTVGGIWYFRSRLVGSSR